METIHLAKWESRFWAWLIDNLLVGALRTGIIGTMGLIWDIGFISLKGFGVHGVLMFAYWTLFEGYNGQSIGKMAMNLKVTDRRGENIDYPAAAIESAGKAFILPLDCLIGWLAMPDSKLRLFNRISNTIVIKTKYEEPEVTYFFLYLLEATDSYREEFDKMSEIVRAKTDNLKKIYRGFDGKPVDNPEEWCKLTGTIDGDIAEVKYYKERIILKVKTKCKAKDLNELFKQAKIKRRGLLKNELVNLENIQRQLREICNDCIKSVYLYPLIEIEKGYKVTDFNLEDEAITTFFYEIPDVGDINRFFMIFPVKYKKVLLRVSGPSVMTTKMSDIMRAKLINLLYESSLYKMRESERESCKECKKIFGSNYEYLRKYIAEIFFSIESGSSGIESGSSFQILSFISAFGALAGILAISYAVFHILPFSLEVLKTGLSILLFFLTVSMLASIVGIDYLKQKFYDKICKYKIK